MSIKHPIIVITGSSGSGSNRVSDVFNHIVWREKISHLIVDGSAFHRYTRDEMAVWVEEASAGGRHLSHFNPEGNRLDLLESLFREFSSDGTGHYRHYLHTEDQAQQHCQEVGIFTPGSLCRRTWICWCIRDCTVRLPVPMSIFSAMWI